jgi:hypothetical protein
MGTLEAGIGATSEYFITGLTKDQGSDHVVLIVAI